MATCFNMEKPECKGELEQIDKDTFKCKECGCEYYSPEKFVEKIEEVANEKRTKA